MADQEPQKGDKVSWSWGNGQPEGKVAEVAKEGEIAIQSNRGNTIKKNADPEDPAVHIERPGNDVVKRASELEIEEKKNGSSEQKADDSSEKENGSAGKKADEKAEANGAESKDTEKKDAANGHQNGNSEKEEKAEDKEQAKKSDDEAQTGDKRKADAVDEKKDEDADEEEGNDDNEEEEDKDDGDEKTVKKQKTDGEPKKNKPGRPKGTKNGAAVKKKEPKKAATETGEPRRSSRHKA